MRATRPTPPPAAPRRTPSRRRPAARRAGCRPSRRAIALASGQRRRRRRPGAPATNGSNRRGSRSSSGSAPASSTRSHTVEPGPLAGPHRDDRARRRRGRRPAQQRAGQALQVERRPLHRRQAGLQLEADAAGQGRVGGGGAHGPVEVGRLPRRAALVAKVLEPAHHPPRRRDLLADLGQLGEVVGRQALLAQGRDLKPDGVQDVVELVADQVRQVGEVAVAGLRPGGRPLPERGGRPRWSARCVSSACARAASAVRLCRARARAP